MHIATVAKDGWSVSWVLVDRGTAKAIFGLEQSDLQKAKTRWGVVVAMYSESSRADDVIGSALTSKKDSFRIGRGMNLALQRALAETGIQADNRKAIWNEVLAHPDAGPLLLSTEAQDKWSIEAAKALQRRGKSFIAQIQVGRLTVSVPSVW